MKGLGNTLNESNIYLKSTNLQIHKLKNSLTNTSHQIQPSTIGTQQKKDIISRRNMHIEESRAFDGEEICNFDKLEVYSIKIYEFIGEQTRQQSSIVDSEQDWN